MHIIGTIHISKTRTGDIWSNYTGIWKNYTDIATKAKLEYIYRLARKKYPDTRRISEEVAKLLTVDCSKPSTSATVTTMDDVVDSQSDFDFDNTHLVEASKQSQEIVIKQTMQHCIDFFSEFSFEPNFRFVNTFAKKCSDATNAIDYVVNYFSLTGSQYTNAIADKCKSDEFQQIVKDFGDIDITKTVNTRFKLYYGSQGTGKTTKAIKEADGNVIVCHSAMLPSDLLEDFKFIDGKAHFTPSALQRAMIEGKTIVLDEINLLPFESLRFLQSILDNKTSINYKGETINIAEGFMIIGTMNLIVNGNVFGLPEPLVDRAADIQQFKLTATDLVGAVL